MALWFGLIFGLAIVLQSVAAIVAFLQMRRAGRYHFQMAWLCISLALLAMLQRRFLPVFELIGAPQGDQWDQPLALLDGFLALGISGLMAVGMFGIRALFLTLEQQAKALREQAETDPLTGLRNRRSLMRDALREVSRVPRSGSPVAVIMTDLDHFKDINDRHGHVAGDAVLVAVAEVLRGQIRDLDLSARWGGEEFLLVLPDTGSEGAAILAERLRRALESLVIPVDGVALKITASFGIATLETLRQAPDVALHELIRKSDQALYRAKESGRNCVVRAPTERVLHGQSAPGQRRAAGEAV